MELSSLGHVVAAAWQWLAETHAYVELDQWIVMPNHLHGILLLHESEEKGAISRKPLGRLIGAFKTVSTKRINRIRHRLGAPFWQRNYWERIIRDDDELARIRWYIVNNPDTWSDDALYRG